MKDNTIDDKDELACDHELVTTEYLSQTYGHCIECNSTVVKDECGNWTLP
jgi:hypothetical protein